VKQQIRQHEQTQQQESQEQEIVMKTLLFVFGLLLAMNVIALPVPAHAQNYPWCARYGTPYSDTSCGFTSFDQCMASVSGIGGFCEKNDTYKPPVAPAPLRHHVSTVQGSLK
jgi:Protein of unknown function (DUF3551)